MWPSLVGEELAAQIHVGLHRILVLVKAFGRGVPDIDLGAHDRLALPVAEPRVHEHHRPRCRRAHDRAAVRRDRRMHAPERSEQARVGFGLAVVAIVEQAHERRDAERARDQDALVVRLVARLAERDDVIHRGAEFLFGEFRLAHEIVDVAHERAHDFPKARVRRLREFLQHRRRDVFLSLDDHFSALIASFRGAANGGEPFVDGLRASRVPRNDRVQLAFFFIGSFTASNVANSTLNSSPFTFSTLRM